MLARIVCLTLLGTSFAVPALATDMTAWTDQWSGFHEIDERDFGLHLSDDKGYGESYYVVAWSEDGEALVGMLSVTNYHPFKNHLQSVDLNWISRDGQSIVVHEEYGAGDLRPDAGDGAVGMGPNRVQYTREGGRMLMTTPKLSADVRFRNLVPPAIHGDGSLRFDGGKSHWTYMVQAPCAEVRAEVKVGNEVRRLQGMGYADHGWATMRVPDFSSEWHRIQVCDAASGLGLSIFQKVPDRRMARSEPLHTVHVMKDGKLLGLAAESASLRPLDRVKHPRSGYMVPTAYELTVTGPNFDLQVRFDEFESKADVDVLGTLNRLTRAVIKTFYAKPWQHWYGTRVHITGTIDGEPVDVRTVGVASAQYYD